MANIRKIFCIFGFSLIFFCVTSCGSNNKEYNISFNCNRVVFENKPNKITALNDFSTKVYPTRVGYTINESNFTVKINNTIISSSNNTWNYANNVFTIFKNSIKGDVTVSAMANVTDFNISYNNYDRSLINPVGGLPTKISSQDFNVKFAVNSNYGFDVDVIINNTVFFDYDVRKMSVVNNNNIYSLYIENKYIINDMHVTLTAKAGALTLSRKSIDLINYDTHDIYCYDVDGKEIKTSYSTDCYSVKKNNENKFTVDSMSDKIINKSPLVFSNSLNVTATVDVTIHHPINLTEALDAVTLGYMRGFQCFDITFDYDNHEDFNEFTNHLELLTYIAGVGGMTATYTTGLNRKNTFSVINISPHGRDYATDYSKHEEKYYRPITSGNYLIRKSAMTHRKSNDPLPIDRSSKSISVYNSEELYWAVEHGYIPLFNNDTTQTAVTIYNTARTACLQEINDKMSNFEKARQLFDYLESITTYDYYVAERTEQYPIWLKHPAFFLEGVFLHDGIAVCDGFAKAYALLGGIERVPIIRSSGVCSNVGHAWNYVNIDDLWYLACPTWAKIDVKKSEIDIYKSNFAVHHYDSFLTSKNYFADSGMTFTDDNFPEIIKETTAYSENLAMLDTFVYGENTYNFYIDSYDKLLKVFEKCHDCELDKQKYALTFKTSDINAFYNDKTRSGWLRDVLNNPLIRSRYNNSGVIISSNTKLAIVTLS